MTVPREKLTVGNGVGRIRRGYEFAGGFCAGGQGAADRSVPGPYIGVSENYPFTFLALSVTLYIE